VAVDVQLVVTPLVIIRPLEEIARFVYKLVQVDPIRRAQIARVIGLVELDAVVRGDGIGILLERLAQNHSLREAPCDPSSKGDLRRLALLLLLLASDKS
jgi:hypothetical protein